MIEAVSWMGRGALAAKQYDSAEKYAKEAYDLSVAELKKRPLDADPHLPLALGAAIEVEAQVMTAQGDRSEAVSYLERQLVAYRATSIRTRIQKNINLLSLEGKVAPPLEGISLNRFRGKPVLLFFWAHWCSDCKADAPILAKLKQEFEPRGLVVLGPTQKYGYVAGGEDAPPDVELRYIEQVRAKYYAAVVDAASAPVSEENFRNYGASTTPTIVLIDRGGIVRLYHPGAMTYEELRPRIEALFSHGS